MTGVDRIHTTEINGMQATWQLDHHRIQIFAVHDTAGRSVLPSSHWLDRVQARERWPELTTLWDAIRRDFWAELTPPQPHSRSYETSP
ncbi:hypothetical protein [Nocardia anaemiae]|uniref:hypothetical protein n=1 Tax=Nocardia anaemiae TaxID=263910 RepID=UPI0007A430C5|nr:hypothetical protein [Nocardia anaemiae]